MFFNRLSYKLKIGTRSISNLLHGINFNLGYTAFLLLSLVTVVVLGYNIFKVVRIGYQRYQFIKNEEQILEQLKAENLDLQEQKKYYSSPEYIEYKSREDLNLTFPGYKIVFVETEEKPQKIIDQSQTSSIKIEPSWRLWINLLFK